MKRRGLLGVSCHSKSFGRIGVSSPILADCEVTYDLCQRVKRAHMLNFEC